jgi:lactate dehydrogenase-like 2-hydroxyacid dehydrogenase
MSITVLSLEPLGPPAVQERLDASFDCWLVGRDGDLDQLVGRLAERVTALVTTGGRGAERELIERLPRLQLIACYGVGVDAIDLDAARSRGVAVTNTPDVLTDDVADLAVLLYGAQRRRLVEADTWVRSGAWETQGSMPLGRAMRGRRVGLIGFGRIGQAIARRLTAFGVEVGYHKRTPLDDDRWPYADSPVALAEQSDDLIVCCSGGPATRHLVGSGVLRALGTAGVLVNVARGSVVDETALAEALQTGLIAGAALDVFAEEPWVPAALRQRSDVVLAPHVGSATVETRTAMGELVLRNLDAHARSNALVTPV